MSETRLGRDVFIALAAIGWADGNLDSEEADAIVRVAAEEGLELEEIVEIENATKSEVTLDSVDLTEISTEDRLFIYAAATWMTRLDGEVSAGELDTLKDLGAKLRLPDKTCRAVDHIAQDVALMDDGDRPARFDLLKLRTILANRLKAAELRRTQAT